MPKIVLHSGQEIECATFKAEPHGLVYQTCAPGSAAYHAHMGWYPLDQVKHVVHDEIIITEVDATDDNAQQ